MARSIDRERGVQTFQRFPSRFSILRHEISVLSPTTQPPNVMKKPTGGGGIQVDHLQGQMDGGKAGATSRRQKEMKWSDNDEGDEE